MQSRISATINPNIRHFAQNFAQSNKMTLSNVLEIALKLLQQKKTQEDLKQGYLKDNNEAKNWANESLKITDFNE